MPNTKKNKLVATLFAAFGGSFGLHKFYLKEVSSGIFFLFFLMLPIRILGMPISAILGWLDAFRLLTMSYDEFDKKYNNIPQNSPYRRSTQRNRQRRRAQETAQRHVQRTAKRHNPFIKSGARFYKDYALDEAAADYEKALEIDPTNKEVLFNIAAIYSLLENKTEAMSALNRLVQTGFKDFDKINKHDDLAYIRIQPEFESFKANGYRVSESRKEEDQPKENLLQDDLLLSQLNKLMELRKKGLLSEAEFGLERKKLMQKR